MPEQPKESGLTELPMDRIDASQRVEYPLKDFFRNPAVAGCQISPDGEWISYTKPYENRMNIFVRPRREEQETQATFVTERDVMGYIWKGSNRIIYIHDTDGDENFHLFAVNRDGTQLKDLTPFAGVRVMIVDDLDETPHELLISMNRRDRSVFDVYRLNIETGQMDMIAQNPGNIMGWMTDHNGVLRVAIASDGVNQTLLYRATDQEDFREIITTNFRVSILPLLFSFDNKYIYASSNADRNTSAIVAFDIENGTEIETLYEHPDIDVSGLGYSKKRKTLTSIAYTDWKRQHVFLDTQSAEIYEKIAARLPGCEFVYADRSKDENTYVIRTYSDRSLGAYYVYDVVEDTLEKFSDLSPWLAEKDMAEMRPISYTSRDGLTIHGYLTTPKCADTAHLPTIVNPHGGPWARDTWGFSPDVQFLANRGYAVLQINFRGSTGYGRKFWEASFKQWGQAMQDDISDGVKWLIEQGIADPKRVGIYGGSYGGYAVLAGLAFTPELYACGVDFVGVSNLFTFLNTIPPYWKPMLEKMYEMVGDVEEDEEMMRAASPVFHVDKIIAPLFVAQGANDPRVNIDESNQIVNALRSRGVEVEYMVKSNEGHGFRNEENKFEFFEAMAAFLDKHLKP